jgi:hypothetical protein
MTVREHFFNMLEKVDQTLSEVEEQFEDGLRVGAYDDVAYHEAQLRLEQLNQELEGIVKSATPVQKEELERAVRQIRQLENRMILKR